MSELLTTYSFTISDIDLITYALRRYIDTAALGGLAKDAKELIDYIDRQKKEKGII